MSATNKKERKRQRRNKPHPETANTGNATKTSSSDDASTVGGSAATSAASMQKRSVGVGGAGKTESFFHPPIDVKTPQTTRKEAASVGDSPATRKYVSRGAGGNSVQSARKDGTRNTTGHTNLAKTTDVAGNAGGHAGCSRKSNPLFDTMIEVERPQMSKMVKKADQQKFVCSKKVDERLEGKLKKSQKKKKTHGAEVHPVNTSADVDPALPDASTLAGRLLQQYKLLLNELTTGNPGLQNVIDHTLKHHPNLGELHDHLQRERGPEPKLPAHRPASSHIEGQLGSGHIVLFPVPHEPPRLPTVPTIPISQQALDNKAVLMQYSDNLYMANKKWRDKPIRAVDDHPLDAKPTALETYINKMVLNHISETSPGTELRKFVYEEDVQSLPAYAEHLIKHGFGRIVEGRVRVNAKNNRQSFITMPKQHVTDRDAMITTLIGRQFALHGDLVQAFVLPPSNSGDEQKSQSHAECQVENTATVSEPAKTPAACDYSLAVDGAAAPKDLPSPVAAVTDSEAVAADFVPNHAQATDAHEKSNNLPLATGGTEYDTETNDAFDPDNSLVTFCDDAEPHVDVVFGDCPKAFVIKALERVSRTVVGVVNLKKAHELFPGDRYLKVRPVDPRVPIVNVPTTFCEAYHERVRGKYFYNVRICEYDDAGNCYGRLKKQIGKYGDVAAETKAILYKNGFGNIAQPVPPVGAEPVTYDLNAELAYREDMRKKCVFSIDPLTARDLDDAMSIEKIADDRYVVGVHISDVSFFINEDSPIDNEAKERATSIYLVNDVIHMLPEELCMKCSLLPNEEKLTFSVFFTFNGEGEVLGRPRITRSIIKCCAQLAYEHAQSIIDGVELLESMPFPKIYNGFERADIEKRVLELHNIATKLRKRRYDNGALSIHNPKFFILLNPKTGEPTGFEREKRDTANFLIEEFMLLANQAVASTIYEHFPKIAFLRCHEAPILKSLQNLRKTLDQHGYRLDITSSKTIYESIQRIISASATPQATEVGLSALLTRPMKRAEYFCTNGTRAAIDLRHYALSVPIYTHFTSPIRRYPDIIVHRILAACCRYTAVPKRSADELRTIARICNDQKLNAKSAGDESSLMYLRNIVKNREYIFQRAAITEIGRGQLVAVCILTGIELSVTYKHQHITIDSTNVPFSLTIEREKKKPVELRLFSPITVRISVNEGKFYGSLVF